MVKILEITIELSGDFVGFQRICVQNLTPIGQMIPEKFELAWKRDTHIHIFIYELLHIHLSYLLPSYCLFLKHLILFTDNAKI